MKSGKIGNNFLAGVSTPVNRVNNRKQVRKQGKGQGKNKENKPLIDPNPVNGKPKKKK